MEKQSWRKIQRSNFVHIKDLLAFLEIPESFFSKFVLHPRFVLNVPRRLAEKMEKNCFEDPLFRQFVPLQEELLEEEGFTLDPVQDGLFCKTGKLLQKYASRVLLIATSACAMHCRYCFRQNFSYENTSGYFEKELAIIAEDPSIQEVILSGGDPLSLSDAALFSLLSSLEKIPHIERVRFHTRFPIGIPERIDSDFIQMLSSFSKQLIFVVHCNHPKELDMDVKQSLKQILRLGIPVLNQSVLLRGVNDDENVLLALSEALMGCGVIPYYLHLLDPVRGTSHFRVSQERGEDLIAYLQAKTSGFGVPRLVREDPGSSSKTPLAPLR